MDWNALKHAYGSAADVPALLASLSPDPEASVWEQLWSRLCHQGTVYSASFAALPMLIDVAEQWSPSQRAPLIALAASILASEDVAHGCRDDLLRAVEWVIPRFQQLCRESLAEIRLPQHDFIYLLQAARSLNGDQIWGQELDHLASGEFPGTCPSCGTDLYLVIGEYGFFTTAEEWIQRPASKPGKVEPRTGVHRAAIDRTAVCCPTLVDGCASVPSFPGRTKWQTGSGISSGQLSVPHAVGPSTCRRRLLTADDSVSAVRSPAASACSPARP